MYTSTHIPTNVVQVQEITVIMYIAYKVDIFVILNGLPANLNRKMAEPKRQHDSPFTLVASLSIFQWSKIYPEILDNPITCSISCGATASMYV
jgi:hypothetical protein